MNDKFSFYLCSWVFLSRLEGIQLTRNKGGLYFKYHLVRCIINATNRLCLEFSLASLNINSHRERDSRDSSRPQPFKDVDDCMPSTLADLNSSSDTTVHIFDAMCLLQRSNLLKSTSFH